MICALQDSLSLLTQITLIVKTYAAGHVFPMLSDADCSFVSNIRLQFISSARTLQGFGANYLDFYLVKHTP